MAITTIENVTTYTEYDDVTELKQEGWSDKSIKKILRGLEPQPTHSLGSFVEYIDEEESDGK